MVMARHAADLGVALLEDLRSLHHQRQLYCTWNSAGDTSGPVFSMRPPEKIVRTMPPNILHENKKSCWRIGM